MLPADHLSSLPLAAGLHRQRPGLARHRVGDGGHVSEPPRLPETMRPRSLSSRLVTDAGRGLKRLVAGWATDA